mmetsp:Transcript_15635/g.39741  ORF Transcript_15635/g.39741 Transcript_15635/m.39741 type:complete len:257 (-) Transcript_15635:676-1446(-)
MVNVTVLPELLMGLQCTKLLLERKIPSLTVAIDGGILYDVWCVVPQDVTRAMCLERFSTQVKLATAIRIVFHAESVAHQELQVGCLCIVNAKFLSRHHSFRSYESQSVLGKGRSPHVSNPVVVEKIRQWNEHGTLTSSLERKPTGLDNAECPSQVFVIYASPTPNPRGYLVCRPMHALQVAKPILHNVSEERRVDKLQLRLRKPQHISEGHRQQFYPSCQHRRRVCSLQGQAQGQHRMSITTVAPGSLSKLWGHTF